MDEYMHLRSLRTRAVDGIICVRVPAYGTIEVTPSRDLSRNFLLYLWTIRVILSKRWYHMVSLRHSSTFCFRRIYDLSEFHLIKKLKVVGFSIKMLIGQHIKVVLFSNTVVLLTQVV